MPLTPGTRLGSYEIVAPLGAGGMGEVYRARDPRLERDIAIKLLPDSAATSPERLARLRREATTLAGLNHPNIVVVHSLEETDGRRFLTMELVEGASLDRSIVAGGLPLPKVIELGIAMADALAAAHEKGIVHRDLKPANVMLTPHGRLKVLDFGIAKLARPDSNTDSTDAATLTTPLSGQGRVLGTVPYMAPEQLRGEAVDARTDVFALGVVLYELTTGTRPFIGASTADVTSAILRDVPPPLASVRVDAPSDLQRIVSRCLEKDPRERFQTAIGLANELRRLRGELERSASGEPARVVPEKLASIAVLPFVNRSASADDAYFADGLADELLGVLSKIPGLRVTARTSSYQFKESKDDVSTIGRKLNVATLLEGSVRKAGNRIRVSVQLVNVADRSQLWSESYDRTLDDIFAVQDDIAQSVVKELRAALLGTPADADASGAAKAEVARAVRGRGADPEAHRLYLLAGHLGTRYTREDTEKVIGYLQQALALDPGFAIAWVSLANAYIREAGIGWKPLAEGYERAREALARALALQPDLADAHVAMGLIAMQYDQDWRAAEASMARALELAPSNVMVLRRNGSLAKTLGRLDDAIVLYRRALDLDPLSPSTSHNLGISFFAADRLTEAEAAFRRALELSPRAAQTRLFLGVVLAAQGRGDEGLAEVIQEPPDLYRLWAIAMVQNARGHAAETDAALRELVEHHSQEGAYQIAEVYGARGDADAAFEWLERAYTQRDGGLMEMKTTPHLRLLHRDPRWGELLTKMRLAD